MNALALALALALSSGPPAHPDPPPTWTGRLYTSGALHVGVRPAVEVGAAPPDRWWGLGATVQITGNVL